MEEEWWAIDPILLARPAEIIQPILKEALIYKLGQKFISTLKIQARLVRFLDYQG
jgi:hypothetical protein